MNKLTIKRLIIYILLAFGITWGIYYFGELFKDSEKYENMKSCIMIIGMLGPAAANFLTRAITKEGMKDSLLKFNIKGNIRYYVIAVAAMIFSGISIGILAPVIYFGKADLQTNVMDLVMTILYSSATSFALVVIYFGEEFGWRGYLFPKLEELMGTVPAMLISSFIWALWHLPLLLDGYNFGKDLKFFPFSNIFLMFLFCLLIGTFLTYLTKKTKSVYPASIAHSFNNNVATLPVMFFISSDNAEKITSFKIISVMYIPISIIFIISVIGLYFFKHNQKVD